MFRRAVGSLLARRLSPRVIPRTAPARSLHSLRDLPIGDVLDGAALFTAAALAGAGGTLAVQSFIKGSGARKMIGASEEVTDMKERFEHWIKKNNKTYRDEEEKAMRFELFKATVEYIESYPPSVQKRLFPEISFIADFTEQERRSLLAFPDVDRTVNNEMDKFHQAKAEKGEPVVWKPAVKKPAVKQGEPAVKQGEPVVWELL